MPTIIDFLRAGIAQEAARRVTQVLNMPPIRSDLDPEKVYYEAAFKAAAIAEDDQEPIIIDMIKRKVV